MDPTDKKFSSVDSSGQICFLHAKHSLRKPWCTKLCQCSQAAKPKSKQHSTDRHHSSAVSPRSAIRLASGNTINAESKKKAKQQQEEEGKQNAWLKVGLRLAYRCQAFCFFSLLALRYRNFYLREPKLLSAALQANLPITLEPSQGS